MKSPLSSPLTLNSNIVCVSRYRLFSFFPFFPLYPLFQFPLYFSHFLIFPFSDFPRFFTFLFLQFLQISFSSPRSLLVVVRSELTHAREVDSTRSRRVFHDWQMFGRTLLRRELKRKYPIKITSSSSDVHYALSLHEQFAATRRTRFLDDSKCTPRGLNNASFRWSSTEQWHANNSRGLSRCHSLEANPLSDHNMEILS